MIRWTDTEQRTLGDRMFERWKEKPLDAASKLSSWVMHNNWPPERKRVIGGPTSAPLAFRHFQALVKAALEKINNAPSETNEAADVEKLASALSHVVVEQPVPYDPAVFMRSQPINVLLQELAYRFTSQQERIIEVVERLEARLNEKQQTPKFAPVYPPKPVPVALPKPGKLRIAIAGLLGDEFRHVADKIGDRAELKNVDEDHANNGVATSVDFLVFNTKFNNHSHFNRVREVLGKDRVICVSGGVSTITQKCFDLLARQ